MDISSMWFRDTNHIGLLNIHRREKTASMRILEALIRNIPSTKHLVARADMNGHMGMDSDGYDGVHGGQGFLNKNEEGER